MRSASRFERIRILQVCLPAALCAVAIAGCSHPSADEGADGATTKAEVTLTRVERADISAKVSLTGTAAAPLNQDVRVSALVAGRIAELNVAEGDRVHVGEVMAKLDDRPYRDQLRQAQAAAQQAKANLENAQLTRKRNEDLFQRGIAARKDLDDARTQESVATSAMNQAEAALELANLQVARSEIHAPLDGAVVKRFVSVGEQVDGTAAQPIVEVANLRDVEFLANSPAMYLSKMHPGEPVNVTSEAVPGKRFPGRVVAISPAVDPATGVGLVRIRVPNTDGLLRLGMFLTAETAVDTHAHSLVVPPEAVYRDQSGEPRVFIVNQTTATATPVTLGIETKDRVELQAGVREGDTVILTGGYGLGDKAQIQAKSR
ncbi:MAG TPA: efflux RND transporter periplasmic adaptor subunit [Candidatus Acidoferrales bacterium]|nr:efflux RND transporter periplasmic adaptor subunit [Candidatus Acidoferrales bacterium]